MKHNLQLLDCILKFFYDNRTKNTMIYNIWKDFTTTDKEIYQIIVDLEGKRLIEKSSINRSSNPAMNMYKITGEGIHVYDLGGLEAKYNREQGQIEKESIKERMEFEKLSGELFALQNKLNDYTTTKWQARWGFYIGAAGVLIALLTLLFKK